jgi:hypothetical protein
MAGTEDFPVIEKTELETLINKFALPADMPLADAARFLRRSYLEEPWAGHRKSEAEKMAEEAQGTPAQRSSPQPRPQPEPAAVQPPATPPPAPPPQSTEANTAPPEFAPAAEKAEEPAAVPEFNVEAAEVPEFDASLVADVPEFSLESTEPAESVAFDAPTEEPAAAALETPTTEISFEAPAPAMEEEPAGLDISPSAPDVPDPLAADKEKIAAAVNSAKEGMEKAQETVQAEEPKAPAKEGMEKAQETAQAEEPKAPAEEPPSRSELFDRGTMRLEEESGKFGIIQKPEKTFSDIISEKQAG